MRKFGRLSGTTGLGREYIKPCFAEYKERTEAKPAENEEDEDAKEVKEEGGAQEPVPSDLQLSVFILLGFVSIVLLVTSGRVYYNK